MASNKSIAAASPALLVLAVAALVLVASSVQAQSPAPAPTPAPMTPAAPTPAPAPSQGPCPSGFSNIGAFNGALLVYLRRGITLILSAVRVSPGSSSTRCICYFSTNITIISLPFFPPIVTPNVTGPLACVPAPAIVIA